MTSPPSTDPTRFALGADLKNLTWIASGLNFTVFQAESPTHGVVALRVPSLGSDITDNINDGPLSILSLLIQELTIYKHLSSTEVPVPTSHGLVEVDGIHASLASFITSDGSEPDAHDAGRILARLHMLDPPKGISLVVQNDESVLALLPTRLCDRWRSLLSFSPDLPAFPSKEELTRIIHKLDRYPDSLLHMDFRADNLRTQQGRIVGVLDWENALLGPAAIDVMRVLEIGGFDNRAFAMGYAEIAGSCPELDTQEEIVLRLDAAVMLALVFFSEAPDAEKANDSVARIRNLVARLST